MSQETLIFIGFGNIFLQIWFIFTLNRISSGVQEIARYSRRTALALPLTSGQAKLINRGFSCEELIALLEKQGGKVSVTDSGSGFVDLQIENPAGLDPELVRLLTERELEATQHLLKRASKTA